MLKIRMNAMTMILTRLTAEFLIRRGKQMPEKWKARQINEQASF